MEHGSIGVCHRRLGRDFLAYAGGSAIGTCPRTCGRRRLLLADTVAKVENRTTPKISRKSIFRRRYCCKALYGRYEDRWSFLCEMMWSLTSPRTKRISGL